MAKAHTPRIIALAAALTAGAALAQPAGDPLGRAQNEQRLQQQRLQRSEREAAQVREEIEALSEQLAALAAEQSRGGDVLDEDRLRLEVLNVQESELMARVGANQNELARLLGALQMYGRRPPPALVVHPDDAKKAVRAAILIRAVTPDLQDRAEALAAEVEAAMRVRRDVASASESLFTTESDMADRAARIEELIAEKQALEEYLMADARSAERDIAALAARIQTLRANPAAVVIPRAPVGSGVDNLLAPVDGAPTRRFGQNAPRGGKVEGWMWAPAPETRIVSPAAGRVDYAGPVRGWDGVLILDAGDGYHLVLAGVETLLVSPGDMVSAGDAVAVMAGESGSGPGLELYLEVRKDGDPVDPARFFAAIGR
jgi:septal ring factor EnvC (AmiA/AmiB activator)